MKPILTTERLTLREMTLDDTDNLLQIFSDPIAMQYYPKTLNRQETKAWIHKVLEDYGKHSLGLWACELTSTGEFVGQCGLVVHEELSHHEEVEIGYLFVRQFWKQGLATEAAKGCMNYARNIFNLNKVISLIRPLNQPSINVAMRIGLTPEKTARFKGLHHIVYTHYFKSNKPSK